MSWTLCYKMHVHNFTIIYTHYSGNGDVVNVTSDGDYIQHDRMNDWKDINEADMKIFIAHLIIMGIV